MTFYDDPETVLNNADQLQTFTNNLQLQTANVFGVDPLNVSRH